MEDSEISSAVAGPIRDQIVRYYQQNKYDRDTDAYCIWRVTFTYSPKLKSTINGPYKFVTKDQQDDYYASLPSQDAIQLRNLFHGCNQYFAPMPIIIHVMTGGALSKNQFISVDVQS